MIHRPERVQEAIRDVLSRVLGGELRDPRVGFVTITQVKVSRDLRHARVYVSRLGSATERSNAVAALQRAAPFLRRALARDAGFRRVPELTFFEDATVEEGSRMETLVDELRRERGQAQGSEPAEDGDPR